MNCFMARWTRCGFGRRSGRDGAGRASCGSLQDLALLVVAVSLVLSAGCASTPPKANRAAALEAQPPAGASHHTPESSTPSTGKDKEASQTSVLARSFEEAVSRGDAAWNAGQNEMAIYLYIQALSFRPRDINTLGKIGSIEQASGDLALAARV